MKEWQVSAVEVLCGYRRTDRLLMCVNYTAAALYTTTVFFTLLALSGPNAIASRDSIRPMKSRISNALACTQEVRTQEVRT